MLAGRNALPQPGSYTHFHWVSALSTDERAVAGEIPMPCDVANASELEGDVVGGDLTLGSTTWEGAEVHVGGGAENLVCPGWLLELKAVRSFAFEHGGGVMPVRPGVDNRTHLNVVINYALAPDVSGSGSGH